MSDHEYALRVTFKYEADIAGGRLHEFASELDPVLHVFATHQLGSSPHRDDPDDGVVVVSSSTLQSPPSKNGMITIDIPFHPAAAQLARVQETSDWALPNSHAQRPVVFPKNGKWELPADASLGFNTYVETATHTGQICRSRAGESLFLLSELFSKNENQDADDIHAEWQRTGDRPLIKGFVDIRRTQLILKPSNGAPIVLKHTDHIEFAHPDAAPAIFHVDDADPDLQKRAAQTKEYLEARANESMSIFFGPTAALTKSHPTYLRRMHCPYNNTTAGLLPGSTYMMRAPRTTPPAKFFSKALSIALARSDANADHLLKAIEAQRRNPKTLFDSTRYANKFLTEMLSVYANSIVYLDDFVNESGNTLHAEEAVAAGDAPPDVAKGGLQPKFRLVAGGALDKKTAVQVVEDYKEARLGFGDDCEGVAHEISVEMHQFTRIQRSALESLEKTSTNTFLLYLHDLAQRGVYTNKLMLAGVTNKKLDPGVRDVPDEDAGAHTFFVGTPTGMLLKHIDGIQVADAEAQELIQSIREQYKPYPWEEQLTDTLIAEGTARQFAFTMPVATYYKPQHQADAVSAAKTQLEAQLALMKELPLDVVGVQMPPTHIEDPNGAIMKDKTDASNFYKGISAAYITAGRSRGILDITYVLKHSSGEHTHGVHFNLFAKAYPANLKVVPYNKLDDQYSGLINAALDQLEPMPALRVSADAEQEYETSALHPEFAQIERLFSQPMRSPGKATEVLLQDPTRMPMPHQNVVISIREQDATQSVRAKIYQAIASNKRYFNGAKVVRHYLSDPPVRGDETSLPPMRITEIRLTLK